MAGVAMTTRTAGVEPLGRTADGRPLPARTRRLSSALRAPDRYNGWLATVGLTLLSFLLRVWNIGRPRAILFDETYYAKNAYALLTHGYSLAYVDDANSRILAGRTSNLFLTTPEKIVHPEVGKWMIAAGEAVFGLNPTGWRISAAVAGALTVMVLIRLVRRITGSTLLGCVAGLLLSLDGLSFVMSRLALLDGFLTFWLVCAVSCLVVDRDWGRRRLAEAASSAPARIEGLGPLLFLRPWRIAAGVCFGLACGTKWSAIYVLAAFGLLVWAWDSGARRTLGLRHPTLKAFVVDELPSVVSILLVAFVVYVLTWTGWLLHAGEFEQAFGADWGTYWRNDAHGFLPETIQSLRSLWHYHVDLYDFHTGVPDPKNNQWSINNATHPYQSHPGGWPILNRPVGVDAQLDIQPGDQGCVSSTTCLRQVLLLGTPLLWWGGTAALIVSFAFWLGRRDWRYGLALTGYLSAWLPWFRYDQRPIFSYYAVAMAPFMVIAITLVIGAIIGPPGAHYRRRMVGTAFAGTFVVLVLINFAYFYPIYADWVVSRAAWLHRMWFAKWI